MRMVPSPTGQPVPNPYITPKKKKVEAKTKKKKVAVKRVLPKKKKSSKTNPPVDLAWKRVKRIIPIHQEVVKVAPKPIVKTKKRVFKNRTSPSCIDDLIPIASKKADDLVTETILNDPDHGDVIVIWKRAFHLTMNSLCKKYEFR